MEVERRVKTEGCKGRCGADDAGEEEPFAPEYVRECAKGWRREELQHAFGGGRLA